MINEAILCRYNEVILWVLAIKNVFAHMLLTYDHAIPDA